MFSERSSLEHGFASIYNERLLPVLHDKEGERLLRMDLLRKASMSIAIVCITCGAMLWYWASDHDLAHSLIVIFAVTAIIGPLVLWRLVTDKWGLSLASVIMPAICDHLGTASYSSQPSPNFPTHIMQLLGVVPHYHEAELTHWISGSFRNTDFDLVQAKLLSNSHKDNAEHQLLKLGGLPKESVVFEGLLLKISVPQPAPCEILIRQRSKHFGGLAHLSMMPVEIDNVEFANMFDILATDPDAAKQYILATTLKNMIEIAKENGGLFASELFTAGFEKHSFYMALERSEKFLQMSDIRKSLLDNEELIHSAFAEIELVHSIISQLHQA